MLSRIAARLLPFALLLGACAEESAPLPPLPVYPAPLEARPLELQGATACGIDADCDPGAFCFLGSCSVQCETGAECDSGACDTRGRCTESTNKSANSDLPAGPPNSRIAGLELINQPEMEIIVAPGEEFVTVTFETSASATPQGGLSYRIESSADDSLGRRVQTSNGGTTHTVVIPTGAANPEFVGDLVDVTIVTPVGTIPLVLKSVLTVAGVYEGTLKLDGLGTEIPLTFGIDGDMGALGTGVSNAFLVVPSGEAEMFGPVAESQLPAQNATKQLRQPLTYESAIGAWVATFSNAYDAPSNQIFGTLPVTQVKREIRYELKVEADRTISGDMRDAWIGLYDTNDSEGRPSVGTVVVNGQFRVTKTGAQPVTVADAFGVTNVAANPQVQNFSLSADCISLANTTTGCSDRATFSGALSCAEKLAPSSTRDLTAVVAGLLAGGLTEDGKTFKEFLAGCAAGTVAACVPTKAQRCGLELQAIAFGLAPGGYSLDKERLWDGFGNLLIEVTGGPQLGAFFVDTESRRDWLENANYGSTAITSAAAAQLNDKLMREYVTKVLDPNIEALRTYLQPSSFAFLSRLPDSADSIDQRDRLLIAMVGSWTATADSLSLAAQRWNEIYRLDGERRVKANVVAGYLGEMYRAAAVIIQLHKEAGKAAEAAPIAAGLNTLLLRYEALTNTFNELLFARDGELAVSSSLDPEQASRGVLAQRHEAALEAVDDASTKVDTLLQTLLDNDIRNADLFANLDNAVNESQKRLVELCGQPVGCDVLKPEDATNKDCDTSWKSGVCGFDQDRSIAPELRSPKDVTSIPAQENASEATLAIYDFGAAGRRVTQAQTHQDNLKRFRDTSVSTTAAFVAAADRAFQDRTKQIQKTYDDFNNNYNSVRSNEDLEIAAISTSIAVDAHKLLYLGVTTAGKIATATAKAGAITTDAGTTLITERVATIFKTVGDKVSKTSKESSKCVELTAGTSVSTGAPVCAVAISGYVSGSTIETLKDAPLAVGQISHTVSVGIQAASDATMVSLDALRELFDASNDFAQSIIDKAHAIKAAHEGSNLLKIENDERFADATYENVTKYAEDLDTWRQMALEDTRLLYEYVDATATTVDTMADVIRAKGSYLQIVESARQERATLEMRRLQRNQIAQLVAGPQAVFFAANGLAEAERELDRAKRKMNDWLVALEYAAVRPFYNERMSILLARNTYQLRAIADRLTDLEGQCGGATNLQDGTVSLRNDLLGLRTSKLDSSFTPPRTLTPAEQFQQTLAQSNPPLAATMRYTVSQTVDQVASTPELLVVNFNLGLSQFANLRATCNAKVAGIALKLVGENLGSGQPYATLLYNGNSQTYSCQPGIDAYVQTFGQGDTTFGATTSFVVDGRAASPVAGIGEMGSSNVTFAGLPLAGNYTLIIDPRVPANAAITWANLEDIELGLSYTYQDVFSSTSDCANSL